MPGSAVVRQDKAGGDSLPEDDPASDAGADGGNVRGVHQAPGLLHDGAAAIVAQGDIPRAEGGVAADIQNAAAAFPNDEIQRTGAGWRGIISARAGKVQRADAGPEAAQNMEGVARHRAAGNIHFAGAITSGLEVPRPGVEGAS